MYDFWKFFCVTCIGQAGLVYLYLSRPGAFPPDLMQLMLVIVGSGLVARPLTTILLGGSSSILEG